MIIRIVDKQVLQSVCKYHWLDYWAFKKKDTHELTRATRTVYFLFIPIYTKIEYHN